MISWKEEGFVIYDFRFGILTISTGFVDCEGIITDGKAMTICASRDGESWFCFDRHLSTPFPRPLTLNIRIMFNETSYKD